MPIHDRTRVGAETFHDFHTSWAVEIKRALNAGGLPTGYYAQVEQVVGSFIPDVLTLRAAGADGGTPPAEPEGGVAVAVSPPKSASRRSSRLMPTPRGRGPSSSATPAAIRSLR